MSTLWAVIFIIGFIPLAIKLEAFFSKRNQPKSRKLSNEFKDKLNLTRKEIICINQIKRTHNNFPDTYCREKALRLFLQIRTDLIESKKWTNNTDWINRIYDYCQSSIQQKYNFTDPNELNESKPELPEYISDVLNKHVSQIPKLSDEEESNIYKINASYWKWKFTILTEKYSPGSEYTLYEEILHLASLNTFVSALREIYFRSYLFMANKHKILSLKLYLHYLSISSESKTFKYRGINQSNKKLLFLNKYQEDQFQKVAEKLQQTGNLPEALLEIETMYIPIRKKITLDSNAIQEAGEEHAEVVKLLSEYMEDEDEKNDKQTVIIPEQKATHNSMLKNLSANQQNLLNLFIAHQFELNSKEIDIFVQSNGIFKSSVIEGINEHFFEILDDVLIEEDGEYYRLNEKYYQQILDHLPDNNI